MTFHSSRPSAAKPPKRPRGDRRFLERSDRRATRSEALPLVAAKARGTAHGVQVLGAERLAGRLAQVTQEADEERVTPARSVRAIHVYFPDPWPKRRHWRRRVLQPPFAAAAARALQPGGSLFFLSDDPAIFAVGCDVMAAAAGFCPQPFDATEPWRPATGYERKWRAQGREIMSARWVRRGR